MPKLANQIRGGSRMQFQIDNEGSFSGENMLRIDALNGSLRLEYVSCGQIISTSLLSINDIFYYLPQILEGLNALKYKGE